MRGVLVTLVAVALLLLAVDEGARLYEQGQVARSIRISLGLRQDPNVALRGFPFLVEMAHGRIPEGSISAAGLKEGPLTFSTVHLVLQHLRFSLSQLLHLRLHSIRAASGVGRGSITANSVNALLAAHRVPFTLSFENGKTITHLGGLSTAIDVSMQISEGTLKLSAGSLPAVSVPLPSVLPGLVYGSARPANGRLIFNFRLRHPRLDLQPT
jgi:hypothetical protein